MVLGSFPHYLNILFSFLGVFMTKAKLDNETIAELAAYLQKHLNLKERFYAGRAAVES